MSLGERIYGMSENRRDKFKDRVKRLGCWGESDEGD